MEKLKQMKLSDYPKQSYDKIRYRDTDRQGHVNNAVFAQFLETGRVEILYDPKAPLFEKGCTFVIASIKTDLIGEINWPGIVKIGTGVKKIGNSSVTFVQGVFYNEKLVAVSETVIVQINETTRKTASLSEFAREELNKSMINN